MSVIIIAAAAKNRVIGKNNAIPWHIPEDMKRFKKLTWGHPVIMGRKTFESIKEKLGGPLPGRKNIVITSQKSYQAPQGVEIFNFPLEALRAYQNQDVFIIGGGKIYQQLMDYADLIYLTKVEKEVEGDTFFPKISQEEWQLVKEEKKDGYSFCIYQRKKSKKNINL